MQLSVREVSRFVIGAAILRAKAIETSGNAAITFDNVALAALREQDPGKMLRLSIEKLADQESGWMRNTPPHILKTERVMQSRAAEIRAFTTISAAVFATIEFADDASKGDTASFTAIKDTYINAFRAIEETPGSTQDRRQLKSLLHDQVSAVSSNAELIETAIEHAERAFLESEANAILSRYTTLDRNDDLKM